MAKKTENEVKETKKEAAVMDEAAKEKFQQMATMFITLIMMLTSMLSSVKVRAMKIANLR